MTHGPGLRCWCALALACCASLPASAQPRDDPAVTICEAIARRSLPKDADYRRSAALIDGRTVEIVFATGTASVTSVRKRCLFSFSKGEFYAVLEKAPEYAECEELQRRFGVVTRSGQLNQRRKEFEKPLQECIEYFKTWLNVEAAFMLFVLGLPGHPIPADKTALR